MTATDQDIFASAMSDTPIETGEQIENTTEAPVEAAPTEAKPERARDEHGRFAPKAPEAPEPVVQETAQQPTAETPAPEAKSDAHVPSWRLAEEAERRREAERQLAEMRAEIRNMQLQWQASQQQRQAPQEPEQPIDPFADPQGFAESIIARQEARLREIQLQNSLQIARMNHKEVFDRAYEEFYEHTQRTRDRDGLNRILQSADPGESLIQWYREKDLHQQLGGADLKTFLDKQREEWLKDPQVQARVIEAFKASQQQKPSPSNINLPPSLSKATSAAPMHDEDIDSSQRGIFQYAMKR